MDKIKLFDKKNLKDMPELKSGMKVKVFQRIKEGDKERLQAFEGLVIAVKHGRGKTGTFTVRKISSGVGVEKVFPLYVPTIEKIEILSQAKVRRAKLYYLRGRIGKRAKMKHVELTEAIAPPVIAAPEEEAIPEEVPVTE